MIEKISTAVGVLKLVPDVIQVGKDIWEKLIPPKRLESSNRKDGIFDQTFFSESHRFSISIPDDEWVFWKPTPQFLASMGSTFAFPTRSMPIMLISAQMIKLFRPNINVTTELVGRYSNIDEMIQVSKLILQSMGSQIDDKNVYMNNDNQSGAIIATLPYLNDTLYQVMHCYLYQGTFYTVNASYVPMSNYSNKLFGGMQEIMDSFKLLKV